MSSNPTPSQRQQPLPPKAVLFDLDGTLADSEPIHQLSVVLVLRKFGHRIEPELVHDYVGWSEVPFWEDLKQRFQLDESVERLIEARTAAYRGLVQVNSVELMPGALQLLTVLKEQSIPLAICSSSPRGQIESTLQAAGIAGYFGCVLSGHEDIENGKPAPDIFLEAAQQLDVPIEECWAVEDSATGTRAAFASGAWTIRVPTAGVKAGTSKEHLRLKSLLDLTGL